MSVTVAEQPTNTALAGTTTAPFTGAVAEALTTNLGTTEDRPQTLASLWPTVPFPGERIVLRQEDIDHTTMPGLPELRWPGQRRTERFRVRWMVRRRDDGAVVVSRVDSEMERGIPRKRFEPIDPPRLGDLLPEPHEPAEPKTWCRWKTTAVSAIEMRPTGEWVEHRMSTGRGGKRWVTNQVFADDIASRRSVALACTATARDPFTGSSMPTEPTLTDYARAYLGEPAFLAEVFPLAEHYLGTVFARPVPVRADGARAAGDAVARLGHSAFRRRFRGARTAADLTRNLFGVRHVRRDLVKAVARTDLEALRFAWQFRGLVPVDWIVTYLRAHPALSADAALSGQSAPPTDPAERRRQDRRASARAERLRDHHDLYRYLRSLDQRSLKRLLNTPEETLSQGRWLLRDLARMPASRDITRVDSWRELHDRTADHMRRLGPTGKKRRARKARLPQQALDVNYPALKGRAWRLRVHQWVW